MTYVLIDKKKNKENNENELKLNATEDETLRIKVNPIAWQEIPKIWNNLL